MKDVRLKSDTLRFKRINRYIKGKEILDIGSSEGNVHKLLIEHNPEKIFLNRFSEKIKDCFWLNDNYLIFNLGEKIIISEIDNRNSVNMITLPQPLSPNDKILFNQEDKKLYILTEDSLLSSEKLLP